MNNFGAAVAALICLALAACSSNPTESDAVLTGEVFSVSCERAWADCYDEAQRRCVGNNFEEIDRSALHRTTTDNQTFNNPNPPSQDTYRAVTFRCK
ncbi:MAG: hypothetical protein ACR2QR_06445 [Woeseiaceae bacterium]